MDPITAVSAATVAAPRAKSFLADLLARGACSEGRTWARTNKIKSPAEAWAKLERLDWMFWLANSYRIELRDSDLVQLAATWADRALHIYAPSALRAAGLPDEAAKLEALPSLAGKASSELRDAAWDAGDAARDAAWAAASEWQCRDLRAVAPSLPY